MSVEIRGRDSIIIRLMNAESRVSFFTVSFCVHAELSAGIQGTHRRKSIAIPGESQIESAHEC